MNTSGVALIVILSGVVLHAQKATLTDQDKADAVRVDTKGKGTRPGLFLIDDAADFAGRGAFRIFVYTPMTWVKHLVSDATRKYQPFTVSDITEEMLEPVLRVIAHPNTLNSVTGVKMIASSIEHVVLRNEAKTLVVQPTSKEPFTDMASSALRDKAYQGLTVKFPLDAVRELRGPNGDKEFLIVVVGAHLEKEFRVKRKHFKDLP